MHEIQPQLRTPRLLKGAHGWWYLGCRQPVRLSPAAVDSTGCLHPEVVRQLQAAGVDEPPPLLQYSLTVLTATACNLGCAYCFQNVAPDETGGYRPPRIAASMLSRRTAVGIIRFVSARMAEAGLRKLHVLLFGGEPLLNPAGCRHLLELAAEHGLTSAQLTTNGTLLTPAIARELSGLGLGNIQITFDGNRMAHDRTRVRRSGGGTFDQILTNMASASEVTSLHWLLRVNVSRLNRGGIPHLVRQIARRVDPGRCHIGFVRVMDTGVGFTGTLQRDLELADEFARWTIQAHELGFGISEPRAAQTCSSCGFRDGELGAVVNADGTLYSCWESAGKPGWEVGTIETGYLPAEQNDGRWVACGYEDREKDAAAASRFQDAVDARVLDYLYEIGQLGRRSSGADRVAYAS